jgi:hypothetical protein
LGAPKPVPGPPKRFAQGMGAAMSTAALLLALVLGAHTVADVVLAAVVVAAGLESIFALCLGCKVYARLERAGMVPACEDCADLSARLSGPGRRLA